MTTTGTIDTPIGTITVVAGADGKKLLELNLPRPAARRGDGGRGTVPRAIRGPIEAYFRGDLDALDAIEIAPQGTPFFRHVWKTLRGRVKPGEVVSYAELARRSGRPKAVRGAAMANARNPIALVIPCHRVIGANGHLWGYGGGLDMKRALLRHEGVSVGDDLFVDLEATVAATK